MGKRDAVGMALGLMLGSGCTLEPKTFDEFGTGGAAEPADADAEDDAPAADASTGGDEAPGDASTGTDGGSSGEPGGESSDGPGPEPEGTDDGVLPGCGDGIVDEGEACDDADDDDTDECTSACTVAACGDGFVLAGAEECDDGNALAGDGCSHHCAVETAAPKRVFITSSMFTGAMGGLAGADAACQGLAEGAGLSGTYLAWLADGIEAPAYRFVHADVPYILVDGTPIAEDWADLVDGSLIHPINLTQAGNPPPVGSHTCGQTAVWSNVTIDGGNASAAAHCAGWTDVNAVQSHSGRYDLTGADWSASCFGGGAVCLWAAPIYCFEQ